MTLIDEYTIGCDVTIIQVPAIFADPHGLMSERSADHQWRHVSDDTVYQVIKVN